jgi:FkbM family methyltransferase
MTVFLKSLKEQGFLDSLHMTIGIIGSRKISSEDEYGQQGWQYFAPNLTIYGFDADADACEEANTELAENEAVTWTERHIPLAISKAREERTLYVTHAPMCSSLYSPNEALLARHAGLQELAGLDFEVEIETTTLDDFCADENIENIDFLQIDVQGADLDVLQGAVNLLSRSVLGIQIEVEFSPLYKDQPLFRDVDKYLDKYNFSLFDLLLTKCTRSISPIFSKYRSGQLLWGEAFYFRDLLDFNRLEEFRNPDNIFKLACMADILQFPDYTLELLEYLTLNYGSNHRFNFASAIFKSLAQFPELNDRGLKELSVIKNISNFL